MASWDDEVQRLVRLGRDHEAAALAIRNLDPHPSGGHAMNPLEQFSSLGPALGGVVGALGSADLDRPTPCADFTVRGVLEHMVGGATAFAAAFRGELPADPPASGDLLADFGQAMADLTSGLTSDGALDRTITAPFGEVPGDAFARFVVLDGLVHGWDMARATGQPYAPDPGLVEAVDAFARAAITPEMRDLGMFAPETTAPAGSSPLDELMAFTGRNV